MTIEEYCKLNAGLEIIDAEGRRIKIIEDGFIVVCKARDLQQS